MKIKVSCILLAAGMSTRMSIGNKLLLSVKGKTIIEKTLEQLNELYAEPSKRAKNKVLPALDAHAITLINHCHFAVSVNAATSTSISDQWYEARSSFLKVSVGFAFC